MRSLLIERHLHHRRRHALAADLDLERRAFLGRFGGEVAGADGDADGGAHRAAADDATLPPLVEDRVAVAREGALRRREADESLADPLLALAEERVASDEV